MKTKFLPLVLVALNLSGIAQVTWNTSLNSFPAGQNANFGTLTDNPILFKTNNTARMTLAKDGKLNIADLAGEGNSLLMVDANGNMQRLPYTPPIACGIGIVPWNIGGNNAVVAPNTDYNSIGTCNGIPFLLKSNNVKTIALQTNGKIGMGPGNNDPNQVPLVDFLDPASGNTNHLKIHGTASGAIETSADMALYNNSGNFGIYNGNLANPSARFLADNVGDMNFYNSGNFIVNGGSPGNSNVNFSIDLFGYTKILNNLDVGNLNNNNARIGVDALNSTGVLVYANNGNAALHVANSAGASRFKVWVNSGGGDDTKAHIAGATQIGFYQTVGMADATTRLNVDASGGTPNGVKVTTNNHLIKTFYAEYNGTQTFMVTGEGKTQIGYPVGISVPAAYWLTVNGKVGAREVVVTLATPWPDYVFEKSYKLNSLDYIEAYIAKNKHLPNMPGAAELKAEVFGLNLGEMQGRQMEKIEELYLHLIELNAEKKELKKAIEDLKTVVSEQQKDTEKLRGEMESIKTYLSQQKQKSK
jgi:hypothetical protein